VSPLKAILALALLSGCGPTIVELDGGGCSSTTSSSSTSSGEPECSCFARPDLGVGPEACGSTLCFEGSVWNCGLSGWTEGAEDCSPDAGAP
jgi:hypothetical protein